jgi:hypothetical protein
MDGEAHEDDFAWTSARQAKHLDYEGVAAVVLCKRMGDRFRNATHPHTQYDRRRALEAKPVEVFGKRSSLPRSNSPCPKTGAIVAPVSGSARQIALAV